MDVQLGGEAADADIQAWVKDLHHIAVGVKAESGALAEELDKTLRESARLLQMHEGGGRPYLLTYPVGPLIDCQAIVVVHTAFMVSSFSFKLCVFHHCVTESSVVGFETLNILGLL